ncbi:MAG TPA: TonB C-terminal domain-containing protein [Candidatus Obscuribacterales bacterium]
MNFVRSAASLLVCVTSACFSPAAFGNEHDTSYSSANDTTPTRAETSPPPVWMPEPSVPKKKKRKVLQGGVKHQDLGGEVENHGLKGQANEDDVDSDLQPLSGRADQAGRFKGSAKVDDLAASQDPDMDDQELQVEWDRWRNRFLNYVQQGVQETLNNPDATDLRFDPSTNRVVSRFPLGTTAWFAARVTKDRRVASVKILKSSGFPNYDRAVEDAIWGLDGTSILRFPKGSMRATVTQTGGIKTSATSERQYFKFGDVERYRVPQ